MAKHISVHALRPNFRSSRICLRHSVDEPIADLTIAAFCFLCLGNSVFKPLALSSDELIGCFEFLSSEWVCCFLSSLLVSIDHRLRESISRLALVEVEVPLEEGKSLEGII
jgi:hypothetical protein